MSHHIEKVPAKDRNSRSNTLTELSATMVAQGSQVISGNYCIFFKATYYNSQTSEETDTDDAEAVEADESSRYTSIYNIRKAAGMVDNPYLTDGYFETKRKQAENEINSAIFSRQQNLGKRFLQKQCVSLCFFKGYRDEITPMGNVLDGA